MTIAARSSACSCRHRNSRFRKEVRFDPDAWIVETEDRTGQHFLDLAQD
jgi:hypothetical protein